jgi:hypothetical protein
VAAPTGKRFFADLVGPQDRHLVKLYRQCAGGLAMEWPDGRALLEQPVKLVRAFGIIGSTLERYKKGK